MTAIERFLSKVVPQPNGCHSWASSHDKDGYALFWFAGRSWRASRFIYEAVHGPLLAQACHRCDIPGCVNVDHLFDGTAHSNYYDSVHKGRRAPSDMLKIRVVRVGQQNGNSKLTEAQVREIRARYVLGVAPHRSSTSLRALAAEYGVSKFAIQYVLKGWKHLTHSSIPATPSPSV